MSNPLINRWGLNLFWYKIWYIDKNQFLFFNQDNILERLLYIYLHFGILYSKNLFFNKYWYLNLNLKLINLTNLKYYRVVEYKNKLLNKSYFYNIRIKTKNMYITKIWILRYQNWIILNFYCFQLITKKKNLNKYTQNNQNLYLSTIFKKKKILKRIKLIIFFLLNNYLLKKKYYSF